ncbi:LacI family DNA-binding transcriptional regulator [Carnobacterium viridans]|uniref:Transcriptional regulator, LacI family n=1 Tax=Carnobacterium viridans TaxID=174587 RepID=A0A1H0Z6X1_9LACT|nr:LacI family DNA-binding transcriptional regulator [Carnobacterium viridans]UDE94772.1 LacI family DNA-binding transcriptional regulator [Carnobacterium viridans]SDQ23050.1 transcriptional regulator, LacI family [Carnobacterium viridans]
MVTIKDIAHKAGVAKSTVSRYLNGGSVSKKTKAKLDQIVSETGYAPNTFAQSLKAKKTKMIGTIIPRLDSFATNTILASIDEELRIKNYQLIITNTNQSVEHEVENIYTLAKQKVDGIILLATVVTQAHRKAIADVNIPVLLLGQSADGLNTIVHQEYEAGFKMGNYATNLGHKNFLYFTVLEEDEAVGQLRSKGVLDALKGSLETTVEVVEISFSFSKAYEKAMSVLTETTATYILCATDNIALAVMKAAHTLGLTIPEDFSLSGFGGYEVTSIVTPTITTVKYPYEELGSVSVANLIDLIEGEDKVITIELPNQLIARESTIPLIKTP